jgi:hypothetical protein
MSVGKCDIALLADVLDTQGTAHLHVAFRFTRGLVSIGFVNANVGWSITNGVNLYNVDISLPATCSFKVRTLGNTAKHLFEEHFPNKPVKVKIDAYLDYAQPPTLVGSSLSSNLGAMFFKHDDPLSDIDLVAGEHTFHCHKVILASRSDVFAALFTHDNMKECQEGKFILNEDPTVVKLFIVFIYTDQIDKTQIDDDKAVQVLMMADKYNVPSMKTACSTFLAERIDVENCCSMLIAARRGNCKMLENICWEYIVRSIAGVKKTEGWREMVETHQEFSVLANMFEHV